MSRPFSYNDENFTVIDNMLFVHFNDMNQRTAFEPVIQIPDEIYKRMCSYGSTVTRSPFATNRGGDTSGIVIVEKDNKHYFAFTTDRPSSDVVRYHYTIYLLKDI